MLYFWHKLHRQLRLGYRLRVQPSSFPRHSSPLPLLPFPLALGPWPWPWEFWLFWLDAWLAASCDSSCSRRASRVKAVAWDCASWAGGSGGHAVGGGGGMACGMRQLPPTPSPLGGPALQALHAPSRGIGALDPWCPLMVCRSFCSDASSLLVAQPAAARSRWRATERCCRCRRWAAGERGRRGMARMFPTSKIPTTGFPPRGQP